MRKLSSKESEFCRQAIDCRQSNTSAYRIAYDKPDMESKSACSRASDLMQKPRIKKEIARLRRAIVKEFKMTIESLVEELEEARQLALNGDPESGTRPTASAAVSATMGKAKVCGLDKQVVDHVSSDNSMSPVKIIIESVEDNDYSDD